MHVHMYVHTCTYVCICMYYCKLLTICIYACTYLQYFNYRIKSISNHNESELTKANEIIVQKNLELKQYQNRYVCM